MPTSVRLDEKTGKLVERLARETDRTKSEVIREAISAYGRNRKKSDARSLFEAIAPYVGIASGGPPDLSEQTGRKFVEALRHRETRAGTSGAPRLREKAR